VFNDSPEIKTVIQELVDRGSWASNNAMDILVDDDGSADGINNNQGRTYDEDTTHAAKLHVEFTAGGAPNTRRYSLTLTNAG
jgi:hypothetical protein